jgi:hypothetical protein
LFAVLGGGCPQVQAGGGLGYPTFLVGYGYDHLTFSSHFWFATIERKAIVW